jgi:hypothetical protein
MRNGYRWEAEGAVGCTQGVRATFQIGPCRKDTAYWRVGLSRSSGGTVTRYDRGWKRCCAWKDGDRSGMARRAGGFVAHRAGSRHWRDWGPIQYIACKLARMPKRQTMPLRSQNRIITKHHLRNTTTALLGQRGRREGGRLIRLSRSSNFNPNPHDDTPCIRLRRRGWVALLQTLVLNGRSNTGK